MKKKKPNYSRVSRIKSRLQKRIKHAKKEMLNATGTPLMSYWLGYLRALEWMMENIGQYMPADQRNKYEAMVEYTINKAGASLLDDWTVTGVTRELWGRYIGLRPGIGGYSTNVKTSF